MASNNTSGITGVYIGFTQKGSNIYKRWIASWLDINHKRHAKAFSIIKYGYDEAFMLAVAYRNEQIKLLNQSGQCYTERHLQPKGGIMSLQLPNERSAQQRNQESEKKK